MLNGYIGCASVNDTENTADPGDNWVKKAFEDLLAMNPPVTLYIPVVTSFDVSGPSVVTIIGFVGMQVTDVRQNGANIEIDLLIVSTMTSGEIGGAPGPVYTMARVLVE